MSHRNVLPSVVFVTCALIGFFVAMLTPQIIHAAFDRTAPVISTFTIPAASTTLNVTGIKLSATDNVGVTGYYLRTSSGTPWAFGSGWNKTAPTSYTFTSAGTKTLYAWAKDAAGNVSARKSANVTITLVDTQAPAVSITSPANNATVKGVITIIASASDNVGVTKVEFYLNGSLKNSVAASPYTYNMDTSTVADGSYTLSAKAYDAVGNMGRSSSVTIIVSNPSPIVFEINASGTGTAAVLSPWDTLAMWTPGTVSSSDAAASPMIRSVCFFNATGGKVDKPGDELYDEDAAGNPVYHFERLTSRLDTVLAAGFNPYLALSFTPIKLASNPAAISSEFDNNTSPPRDWDKYYHFINALFTTLNSTYGEDQVASWRYRCGTEPDNSGWWTGTMQEYFKYYDYTVSAARAANPGVRINPGNFSWYGTPFIGTLAARIQAGTFAIAGEKPSVPTAMSISYYQNNPVYVADAISSIRSALAPYSSFAGMPLGIDEGYVIGDENGLTMYSRLDGTELGGAHFALLTTTMVNQNLSWGALWNTGSADVPPPGRNVLDLFQRLLVGGTNLGWSQVGGQPSGGDLVGGLVVRPTGAAAGQLRLMLFNYNGTRSATTTESTLLRLRGMPASGVNVTYYRIDRDHANYSALWLTDSAGMSRNSFGFPLSPYDLNPTDGMLQDGRDLWNAHVATYAALARVVPDVELTPRVPALDGTLEIPITLPPHGVVFVQLDLTGQASQSTSAARLADRREIGNAPVFPR